MAGKNPTEVCDPQVAVVQQQVGGFDVLRCIQNQCDLEVNPSKNARGLLGYSNQSGDFSSVSSRRKWL